MSGIAVMYHGDGRPVHPERLDQMVRAMAHRGPDGTTQWVHGAIGLGHCLMHTTTESLNEHYPMSNGERWIVWDGRLDNRQELLDAFNSEHLTCGEQTDPELALGAYRLWGERCAEQLLGEFAFLIWNARTRTLFGARDRIGLKPFFYTQQGAALFVASEVKALFGVLDHRPAPDDEMILAVLLSECRDADNHRSLFAGIHRLPPGHTLRMQDGRLTIKRYWQIDPTALTVYRRPEAYVEHFLALFEEVVKCRTRSAFPLGAFLSGGLDSAAVTALAASFHASVEAFTAYGDDPRSDERPYAYQVCQAAGIPRWDFTGPCRDPLQGLDELLWQLESPMVGTDRNAPALAALVRSRNCRIILDGHGADDLLDEVGYLSDLLLRTSPARFVHETRQYAQWYGESFGGFASLALKEAAPMPFRVWGKRLLRRVPRWVNPHLARTVDLDARIHQPRTTLRFPSHAQLSSALSILDPNLLLRFELMDLNAAGSGREAWHPFLDSRLIEFVLSIPWTQRCQQGERHWLLRQAMRGKVPPIVLQRRGKGDWTTGMDEELRALCRRDPPEPLANRSGMLECYLDLRNTRTLIQTYLQGRGRVRWDVWSCVTLDHWLKRFWKGGERYVGEHVLEQKTLQPAEAALIR